MSPTKTALLITLGAISVAYFAIWVRDMARRRRAGAAIGRPSALEAGTGFVTNFFDALGIGSFAPTTSVFKLFKLVADERIPGTLNVGHALPTVAQALIFISIIEVEMTTLVLMIAASVAGAWLGAGVVASLPRRRIQLGMGIALMLAAGFFAMTNLRLFPGGGLLLGLEGLRLGAGLAGNFLLGALMTLGIGLYAPCMILVSLLGMNPIAAFPIMMGSCAFLMPVGSVRFIRKGSYSPRQALGLLIGGVPGVMIAAYVVRQLPLTAVRWLVVVVVVYAATAMLRSAFKETRSAPVVETAPTI